MKTATLLFFLFIGLQVSNAQLVQVSGFIYQRGDSSVTLPHASIINKKNRTGAQSSVDGFYTLLMSPGDTAVVSLVGYKDVKFTLPQGIASTSYHKNIYLKDDVVELKGHTVYSITWEKFKESFASIEVVEEKVYLTMDNKLNDRTPVNASPHIGLNGPISWLYNKLGKKAKEQEKLQELREGSNPDMEYTRRITNQYVMNATQLTEEHVNSFLTYCYSTPDFYAYSSDYDIKTKFLTCLPGFKQKYNISDPVNVILTAPADSVNTKP